MRTFLSALLLGMLLCAGCASRRAPPSFSSLPSSNGPAVSLPNVNVIMTPDTLLSGKISKVNQEGRFVVMTFPIGHLPTLNQHLNIFHGGLKAGEIRVTGPQLDDSVVGDIATGDAQPGDEVRAQ